MQLTRRVTMAEVESLQACCCLQNQAVWPSTSGRVGFEPYGAEVVPWSQAYVRVESGGQAPEQGDGGLGAALFDALDLIGGHVSPAGQVGDAQTQGAALIVYGLAEGQCLADGDPLRI